MSGHSGWIGTQSIVMSELSDTDRSGLNTAGNRRGMSEASRSNLEEGAKPGFGLSAQRNLSKCIDIFYWSCKRSRGLNPITRKMGFLAASFITLTIPDLHEVIDSKKGYERLLKGYIKWLCATYGVQSYVWKFEWQVRGQGHWHMFTDRFISVSEARREWLRRLEIEGLTRDYFARHSYEPKYSCKVKGLKNERELREYLKKYMSKCTQNEQTTEGRAWGASMWIKKAKKMVLPITDQFMRNMELACEVKAYFKSEVKVPALGLDGKVEKNQDGSDKELLIGISLYSSRFGPELLLCSEQQKWYDEYIKAYQERDWERTHRLSFDMDKIIEDGNRWHQSAEYIEQCRKELVAKLQGEKQSIASQKSELLKLRASKVKTEWERQGTLYSER